MEQNIKFLVPGSAKYRRFSSNILRQNIEASGAESVCSMLLCDHMTFHPCMALHGWNVMSGPAPLVRPVRPWPYQIKIKINFPKSRSTWPWNVQNRGENIP